MATEGVSYISGRSESLCALFCFLACGFWATAIYAERKNSMGWTWRAVGLLSCLLAMLSKEVGLMCPAVLLAMDALLSNKHWKRIRWGAHLPLFALLTGGIVLRLTSIDWVMTEFIPKEADRSLSVQLTTLPKRGCATSDCGCIQTDKRFITIYLIAIQAR